MGQYVRTSDVAGGRIRAVCPRCDNVAYLEVAQGDRRRVFRCKCGKSTSYSINYRKERREIAYGPARVVMKNAQEKKIRLNDLSIDGVSFYVAREFALAMRRGQEIAIKFRSSGSSMMQRKVCVRNIKKNRIGAEYVRAGRSW